MQRAGKGTVTSGTALREEISISKNPKTQKHILVAARVSHLTPHHSSMSHDHKFKFNHLKCFGIDQKCQAVTKGGN